MSSKQENEPEETPAKRGQAYFSDMAAQVAKRNAAAQSAARELNKERDRKRVISLREADQRDVEAAIRAHEKR